MLNELRRVVITGVGLVTPLGVGAKQTWPRLLAGQSGIKSTNILPDPAFATLPSRVAGIVPQGSIQDGGWDPRDHLSKTEERNMALFSQYAVAAAEEALKDAGVASGLSTEVKENTGVVIGSGIGNLEDQHKTSVAFDKHGHHKTHPLYVPRLLINMAAGHVAMRHGFQGPNLAPTTACTTGLHAILEGARLIRDSSLSFSGGDDDIKMVVAGASEACIHPLAISGFARARTLSTKYNDTPGEASRPFDQRRDGFVIGEGAGVVILEERDHAIERGAQIYAELVGAGMSCDASHMTTPPPDGNGAFLAMKRAMSCLQSLLASEEGPSNDNLMQHLVLHQIDYINAHATGTNVGDTAENRAIRQAFEPLIAGHPLLASKGLQDVKVGSTKGATGHLLGAAGAVEAIFTLLSLQHGVLPGTLNLTSPGPAVRGSEDDEQQYEAQAIANKWDLGYLTERSAFDDERPRVAMTNSFGFGGTNASALLRLAWPRY